MVKRGKFGDRPGTEDPLEVATRAVAPMPLTTQPMVAVRPDGVEPRSLAHTVEAARTAMIQAAGVPAVLAERGPATIEQQPPEIGLTQHHLPEDRKPDERLILHLAPDSERAAQFRTKQSHRTLTTSTVACCFGVTSLTEPGRSSSKLLIKRQQMLRGTQST